MAAAKPMTIKFYAKGKPFYEFSNFYPSPFELDGHAYATAEHAFQAPKFPDHPEYAALIRSCEEPGACFNLARQRPGRVDRQLRAGDARTVNALIREYKATAKIRPDWDTERLDVMRRVLRAKFTQNPELAALLRGTGAATIVEDSPRDSYWGVGKNGEGDNWLGRLLMELRSLL